MGKLSWNCDVDIRFLTPEGRGGSHFVPEYWVIWSKEGKTVAHIFFFLPSKDIRNLQIHDPVYNLNKVVEVPNLGELLRRGNAPKILLERLGLEKTNILLGTNTP